MKSKILFSVLSLYMCSCSVVAPTKTDTSNNNITFHYIYPEINRNASDSENISVTFYYNTPGINRNAPISENTVINRSHRGRFEFTYEEINQIASITSVLNEKPVYTDCETFETLKYSLAECVCVIKNGDTQILRFTYKEFPTDFTSYNDFKWIGRVYEDSGTLLDYSIFNEIYNENKKTSFTYKAYEKKYMLCNGKLIEYNEVYGNFAKKIIKYIHNDEKLIESGKKSFYRLR